MAELFDKIIQDGRVSFVPRSNKTRRFWDKYNAKIAGSSNAQRETVTWMPATEEEMAQLRYQQAPAKVVSIPVAPVPSADIEILKNQLALQQEQMEKQQKLIEQLLTGVATQTPDSGQAEPGKEKGKPGPKPKNNTNGEDQ